MLFLIEGLDCSGKKTAAKQVESLFKERGYSVRVCIGPLFAPLQKMDDFLVSLTYKSVPTFLLKLRKRLYLYAPLIDAALWHPEYDPDLVLKISSRYRTWARAVIENDHAMIRFYERHRRRFVKYSGAVVLEASFDERLRRHREMFALGLTHKTENRRFLGGNHVLFDRWNHAMKDLMQRDIQHVAVIDTTGIDEDSICRQIVEEIERLLDQAS